MSHAVRIVGPDGSDVTDPTINRVGITYGRQDLTGQPSPTSCSLELLWSSSLGTLDLEAFPLGGRIEVYATPAGEPELVRFIGSITDVTVDRDLLRLTCVADPLQRLARQTAVVDAFPSTSTETAIGNVIASLPDPVPYTGGSSSTFVRSPEPLVEQALSFCQTLASSEPAGVLYETPFEVRFAGQDARDDTSPDLELAAGEILQNYAIRRSIVQLCNRAVVVDAADVETVVENVSSSSLFGVFEQRVSTYLADPVAALNYASWLVSAGVNPAWILSGIELPVGVLPPARQTEIVELLEIGTCVEIPELYPNAQTVYFLEGYDEELGRGFWDFTLYLSDIRASWNPQQWDDLDPSLTWNATPASLRWADLAFTEI